MPVARFQMPDGRIGRFEVPEGTTPETAQSLIEQHINGKAQTSLKDDAETSARQFSQGITAGFGDEIKSGAAALTASAMNKLSPNPVNVTMGQFYDQAMADEQAAMEKDMQNSPYLSTAANLAGGLVTGKAAAGRLASTAPKTAAFISESGSKAGQIAKNAAIGAGQGGIYGAGSADVTKGESRLNNAGAGAGIGALVGGAGGALLGKRVSSGNTSLNQDIVEGTGKTRQEIGDEISGQILQAGNAAKLAKTKAYEISDAAAGNAYVENADIRNLASAVDNALDEAKLNPRLMPAVTEIKNATAALKADASNPQNLATSYARVNDFIKELRAMPYSVENYPAVAKAKEVFGKHMQDWIDSGKIKETQNAQRLIGEDGKTVSVIDLIKDANQKNITWKQNFSGKDANKTIKDLVSSQGDSLTPENLVNKLTSQSQSAVDAIKAVKTALGDKVTPVIREGFINKLRSSALDTQGNINPKKLADSINKLIENKTLAEQVFTKAEMDDLYKLSQTAGNVKKPGALEKMLVAVGKRIPVVGGAVEQVADMAKREAVKKQLLNSGNTVKYKTLFGLGGK